jgi:hypothetical protein
MTTTTIIGQVANRLGFVRQTWLEQGRHRPELRSHHFAASADEYSGAQPERIPLELNHGRRIGEVRHLERRAGKLWAVAEVHDPAGIPPNAVHFSPTIHYEEHGADAIDIELRSLSLTDRPATVEPEVVHELLGDLRHACRNAWRLHNPVLADILGNALANKTGTTRIIEDHLPEQTPTLFERRMEARTVARPSGRWMLLPDGTRAEVEYRPARIIAVEGRPVRGR